MVATVLGFSSWMAMTSNSSKGFSSDRVSLGLSYVKYYPKGPNGSKYLLRRGLSRDFDP